MEESCTTEYRLRSRVQLLFSRQVLLYHWLQDLFRRPDVTEFNFHEGESDFKRMFATRIRFNRDLLCAIRDRSTPVDHSAETIWRATNVRSRKMGSRRNTGRLQPAHTIGQPAIWIRG